MNDHIDVQRTAQQICADCREGERLCRVFRVLIPFGQAELEIQRENDREVQYSLIKRTMDRLITGYDPAAERNRWAPENPACYGQPLPRSFISDQNLLFSAMGLDGDGYEPAKQAYDELLAGGHFIETPQGLVGLRRAVASLQENVNIIHTLQTSKYTVDLYNMHICTKRISILYAAGSGTEEMRAALNHERKSPVEELLRPGAESFTIVCPVPQYLETCSADELTARLRQTHYSAQEQIDRDLPRGYAQMSLADSAGEDFLKIHFIPFYVGVFRKKQSKVYRLYSAENWERTEGEYCSEITEINLNYGHEELLRWLRVMEGLSFRSRPGENEKYQKLRMPLPIPPEDFPVIKERGPFGPRLTADFTEDGDGNYVFHLTDEIFRRLLGGEDLLKNTAPQAIHHVIAQKELVCLTRGETGRLVRIQSTPAQRELCSQLLRGDGDPETLLRHYFHLPA